ncbi:bifunctional methylenetetrahydrofolate dehydrogenase/methenyltetrahydrofolate cyclohydrolase FolD [Bdellovibrio bacteriovorus]|uniref:bifunctional methylenetetrahydrofolate dehydrogenase/methenyltetrahydrofolate cyclohydrolase FolD n=1 Tax=Bdellovibrio bacteriovorus TaxID=959 RepID=UPI0021CFAB6F|nr:bifunctional methylenetetrahydrofolate dehydrogenase/methenyltetrahydrofolate cyclohydrolase FolD [Bdellovibrio bacteriovorus]UXR64352.1 bifunctional methylenetetrahydrofolate dehydrogenase/methenyltetrahydrofolate cyclohydrolase FolD [Bdellovibrio bacteriovorus]
MLILNGKEVAKEVRSALVPRVANFKEKTGRAPHLSVVIVGDDPASHTYVKNKKIACEKVGMTSTIHMMPVTTTQAQLNEALKKLNADPEVDGILVQFPLPKHLSSDEVLKLVSPEKDADGLTYVSLGYFFAGKPFVSPCTPAGVMQILKHYQISVQGLNAVVVGRSNIVGKPMAHMLTEAHATVTLCHSKTQNLSEMTRQADIVVVAAGKARFMGKEDFKKEAIVIDVGMHGTGQGGKLCGDVRFEELDGWVKAATPVPGGVGPMTIAMLLQNTCLLAEKRAGF